jgi:hypothetical protein
MVIKRIRQQLADFGLPTRSVDLLGRAGPKVQLIGLAAGLGVVAEKGPESASRPVGNNVIGGRRSV